jgi:hypothetical protein
MSDLENRCLLGSLKVVGYGRGWDVLGWDEMLAGGNMEIAT